MKKILETKLLFFFTSIFCGVMILVTLSSFQKYSLGIEHIGLKGFILPICIGATIGFVIGNLLFKNFELIRKLKKSNNILDEQVKKRTAELSNKNKELEQLSNTDSLTLIANRRHFDFFLKLEYKRLARTNSNLSIILCDIDYFKIYNDTYGHQAGDDCLKKVVEALCSLELRATDLLARYGGEEFVIVLPDTKLSIAGNLAEKLRANVEKRQIINKNSLNRIITMSFGVASISSMQSKDSGVPELLLKADKALYKAKKEGRNKVSTK